MSSLGWGFEFRKLEYDLDKNETDAAKQRRFTTGRRPVVLFHEYRSLVIHEFIWSGQAHDPPRRVPLASLRSARGETLSSVLNARFARYTPEIVLLKRNARD